MNPLRFPPAQQAKAIASGLATLATGAAAGDLLIAICGALASFYLVFAVPNGAAAPESTPED